MLLRPDRALYALLAAFLVAGLLLYGRAGLRLGGVLVLPLLLLCALAEIDDPAAQPFIAAKAPDTIAVSESLPMSLGLIGAAFGAFMGAVVELVGSAAAWAAQVPVFPVSAAAYAVMNVSTRKT